jgi:hypothetical protein
MVVVESRFQASVVWEEAGIDVGINGGELIEEVLGDVGWHFGMAVVMMMMAFVVME